MDTNLPPDDELELEDQDAEDQDIDPDSDSDHSGDGEEDEQDSKDSDPKVTEKRLKDTQAALTRKSQEAASLKKEFDETRRELAELRGMVKAARKEDQQQDEENELAFLDKEDEVGKLLDDPKNVAIALKRTVGSIGKTLQNRDAWMLDQMKKLVSGVATDEGRAISSKIAELRKDDDYSGFSDDQLAVIAKKQVKRADAPDKFRGTPGGSRSNKGGDARSSDVEKLAGEYFKQLYPDIK